MTRAGGGPAARFYFSFRSPYSWLCYRDLMDQHRSLADQLDWRPFWEPDEQSQRLLSEAGGSFPYVPMSRAKALYILQDVRRLTRRRGLDIAWPVDRAPCWEVSHLAYLVASRLGRGPEFVAAVYRARWERGLDISDRTTVASIAAELGLDPGPLAGAADNPEVRAQGVQALLDIDAGGVFGVPFLVHGRDRYWGMERLPDFIAAVRGSPPQPSLPQEHRPPQEQPVPTVAAADQGHAGGCG